MFLFLLENKNQLRLANSIINKLPFSSKYALFTFDRCPPFFVDDNNLKGPFTSWKKFGFFSIQNDQFWLHNFFNLSDSLGHFSKGSKELDIIFNKYFCMDLHWRIGNNYIQPLFLFKKFLDKEKINKVYLKLRKDFISDSIKGICGSLEIEATNIFDHKY